MADTKKKVAFSPAAGKPAAAKAAGKKEFKYGAPRNYDLGNGLYRFSRTKMFHKKALWKFVDKKNPKKETPKKQLTKEKTIGGEKNGGKRIVSLAKKTRSYPTCDRIRKHPAKKCFRQHKRSLRSTLQPGKVVILLAGVHKGKRAVFLKQLASGLLLITGPFTLNGVPLRRIHQSYVIATSTKIDISKVEIPSNIDDAYFKRLKAKRAKKEDGDPFVAKKEQYKPSEQRKSDQKVVDGQLMKAIKTEKDSILLRKYLCTMFGLRTNQYPHRMKF
ncbi:hypothetical protein LSTR_LSTR015085 [Laodelphax striatellus]|uniref:60S ribosomal protein L6 n=1 Tax=Laodelphax striatellus TaxID=195883 RepID=A0A482X1G6_LAOST|nr:hypothetical protein LSTR_LSTR007846 [Laodelphax striatellus]RZF39679.1 hypothetical protein LSTR_LSTR015085 [Laodelphax striatellus]